MPATPEDLGLSSPGLELASAYVQACVERGEIAGAVVLVSRRDQVAQLACVGLRDVEAGSPMKPDTIFCVASMTKPIISVGALMLVEAGKLRLDDPVSRYIPEFADATVFAGVEEEHVGLAPLERPITVYHLLTHTSGLAYEAPHPMLEPAYDDLGDFRYGLPEMMRRLARHPLAHQPGEGWRYGWSHDVLGRVIEVAADQPLDDYLASAIFAPANKARVETALREELARTLDGGFTAEEIEPGKRGFLEARRLARTQDRALTARLASYLHLGRTLAWDIEFEQSIAALAPDQVRDALRRHLDLKKLSVMKAGDFKQ